MTAPVAVALLLAAPFQWGGAASLDGTVGNDPNTSLTAGSSAFSARVGGNGRLDVLDLTVSWSPRLTWASAQPGQTTSLALFNSGAFSAEGGDTTTRVRLNQTFSFGVQDYSALAQSLQSDPKTPPPPVGDRLPSSRFLDSYTSASSLGVREVWSRTQTLNATLGFTIGGGLGHDGRAALPLQRGGNVELGSSWKVSSRNDLALTGSGGLAYTGNAGASSATYGAQVTLRRLLFEATTGSLAVGVAVLRNRLGNAGATTALTSDGSQIVPTVTARLAHSLRTGVGTFALTAEGSSQTALDPLTGGAYLRGTARLGVGLSPLPTLNFTANLLGDRVLSGLLRGAWGGVVELAGTLQVQRRVSLRLTVRGGVVTPTRFLLPDEDIPKQWACIAGVSTTL